MAELNFPQDRTELDPPGSGALQTGDEYRANGTTWIYDSVAKAWGSGGSGDSLSDLYLSKVNDDTAAGAITFEDQTTHKANVIVTDGKVGIGTTNPATALHISGTGVSDSRLTVNRSGSEGVVGVTGNDLLLAGQGSDGSNGGINFYTGGSSSAVIDSSGNATFKGLTTHEAGVKVTGGNINDVDTGFYRSSSGDLIATGRQFRCAQFGNADKSVGISCNPNGKMSNTENLAISLIESTYGYGSHGVQELSLFRGAYIANTNCKGSTNCFTAEFRVNQTGADNRAVGFYSKVDSGDSLNGPAYGFYAEGTAENLFQGFSTFNSGLRGIGGSSFRGGCVFENTQGAAQKEASLSWSRANDQVKGSIGTGGNDGNNALYIQSDTEHPIIIGTHDTPRLTISENGPSSFAGNLNVAGTVIFTNQADGTADVKGCTYQTNGVVKIRRNTSSGSDNPCIELKRTNSGSSQGWMTLKNSNHDGSVLSKMTIGGDLARIVDARLSPTGTPLPDGAADIVKLLQPKVITQQGHTFQGFLPDDLTPVFSDAVFGTAGETVTVGTYTDADGVVETEVEEPEAIPYGATWEQTGTKDVMQSVCRERLIPLLTKALQEALDKIETLETRLNDAGIA